jgi:hypothetical protein
MRDNAISNGTLVNFPKRSENVTTPALQAAAQLLAVLNEPTLDSSSLMSSEDFAAARAEDIAERSAAREVEPEHDSTIARATWLMNEAYKRVLSGEQQQFLETWRKQHPRDASDIDAFMTRRHRGKEVVKLEA